MLEISIRQIGNIPFYIPIGVAKKEFVPAGTTLNLFTTLGKGDEGYINVDFARGSGLIYSKIVDIPNSDELLILEDNQKEFLNGDNINSQNHKIIL